MKCEHCGNEAPERAVICPECGEILPREPQEETPEAAPIPNAFAMPFLSTGAASAESASAEDPREILARAREKRRRRTRRIVGAGIGAVLIAAVILYWIFFSGFKLAAYRYVKAVDNSNGSHYVALVPDEYMDYLESTYSTTRREIKEMVHDYFLSWNKNYGNPGGMSYRILAQTKIRDEDDLSALEAELKENYGITVEIQSAVTAQLSIDDGGETGTESVTFVKIGMRWCCMQAMEDIDYVCQYDGYDAW